MRRIIAPHDNPQTQNRRVSKIESLRYPLFSAVRMRVAFGRFRLLSVARGRMPRHTPDREKA